MSCCGCSGSRSCKSSVVHKMANEYAVANQDSILVIERDIKYYRVGRNSGGYFFLGVKNNSFWALTVSYDPNGVDTHELTYELGDSLDGHYLGHY